ncbi:MAG: hypothetical protein LKF87_13795 [Clostridium tyrobutyricum]|jgi:hypothetical protein|uniref:hypothetical protein n=1 Tax=Clostridium tyrobutyricum TaxID=1519 RepID=UPI00242DAC03|nr:hypothetical protein [Clostridium tyrobutyricum]MCH4198716.1 hypothetical protein [Clostridium tyrobutyricum]MCH4259991.1 hypothetical protein [Clostridium tyrobutyricum]MCI1239669.1 hypothetical protein [Clostridium tyrobutyricum]MCI1652376.1 hypothetical protein [Clostridium tyrobutyricum]MCI1938085.1 hypothetical protein [Clostridium tyrobutyricum]
MEKLESNNINNEEKNIDIDDILKSATQAKSKDITRSIGTAGVMSIVNARTGSRFTFSNVFLEKIGNPEEIEISYDEIEKTIIVGQSLGNENSYKLRRSGNKRIIYCKALVEEISKAMELEFSNRTSITFQEAEYIKNGENTIAVIKSKK